MLNPEMLRVTKRRRSRMSETNTDLLVVSAHAADFVWRAGGLIAKYSKRGLAVKVVALTFGERGESDDLWKQGKNLAQVKQIRKVEAERAADILGVPIRFMDWDDYPLIVSPERQIELAKLLRELDPEVIATHSEKDLFNFDHETAAKLVADASILSTHGRGVLPEMALTRQPRIFGYEPHQPELAQFYPDVIVDISEVYEKKKRAMDCFETQKDLIEYYDIRSLIRGNQARRISPISNSKHAEAFMRRYPQISEGLL